MAVLELLWLLVDWKCYFGLILAYVIYFYVNYFTSPLPPGPLPLPVVGNYFQLTGLIHHRIAEIGRKYGDVFTIYVGSMPHVIVNNYRRHKELFINNSHIAGARGHWFIGAHARDKDGICKGILMSDGRRHTVARNLFLNIFKDSGLGKTVIEDRIIEEAAIMIKLLSSKSDVPVSGQFAFRIVISNITNQLLLGQRFAHDDPQMLQTLSFLNDIYVLTGTSALLNYLPPFIVRNLGPGDPFMYKRSQYCIRTIKGWIQEKLDERKQMPEKQEGDVSLIAEFIRLQQQEDKATPEPLYTDFDMQCIGFDIWITGTDTISLTLQWACLYLSAHPAVQAKVHEEIDKVIGTDHVVEFSDRKLLPYTDATLHEVDRIVTLVPIHVPHKTTEEITIKGYTLPVGTIVTTDQYNINHDTEYWDHPYVFDPNHFLDDNGKVQKNESFVIMTSGARKCVGEPLAEMELFIFFTSLLQNFSVRFAEGHVPESFDPPYSAIALPPPTDMYIFKKRT